MKQLALLAVLALGSVAASGCGGGTAGDVNESGRTQTEQSAHEQAASATKKP